MYVLFYVINPLNAELNPISRLLILLKPRHIFPVSGLKVNARKMELIVAEHFWYICILGFLASVTCGS
jgi:hypothetical protein